MKTSKELKEARSLVSNKITELSAVESRTEAQTTELENALVEERRLGREIELSLELEKRNLEAAKAAGLAPSSSEEKEIRNFSLGKVINAVINNQPLTGLERELADESQSEARANGFQVQGTYLSSKIMNILNEKRAMSAGSSTAGGNTIQTDKMWAFDALYNKRVLQELGVEFYAGLSNNLDLTGLGTGVTTYWGTETASITDGSPVTAARSMTPKRLGAYVPMSRQLLIQNPMLEGKVLGSILEAIYVAVEGAYINGSGSSGEPTGLLGTSGIQSVAMGTNGAVPSLAKILELVAALGTANANEANLKFLINSKVKGKLQQTSIDTGSGAMIMAYQNYFGGTTGVIDGKLTAVTSNVPSNLTKGSGTGLSPIICGEFSKSVVGQFGGMDILTDPYTLALTGQTRLIANTFWDMAFLQPAVFGVIPDVVTA